MKSFIVEVREVHVQPYEIRAKNKTEAVRKVQDGEGDIIEGGFVYSHTLDPDNWTVEESK